MVIHLEDASLAYPTVVRTFRLLALALFAKSRRISWLVRVLPESDHLTALLSICCSCNLIVVVVVVVVAAAAAAAAVVVWPSSRHVAWRGADDAQVTDDFAQEEHVKHDNVHLGHSNVRIPECLGEKIGRDDQIVGAIMAG